ncbi:hypothetical protein BGZ82_004521 [Podila clonocystis]|nr:hypothetical protein BGZ82_004521 [Podila clonocystis]
MALWDTMMVEDHLKSGKYCIRTKRLSGHHHHNSKYLQFQRRSSEATLIDFDHHRSLHHWVFTSPESTTSTSFSLSSPSTTSSGRYLLSSHRRTDRRASDRGPTSSSSSTIDSPMSSVPSPSTCQSTRTHTSEVSSPLSLPPIVERFDMVGSPFLPTSYQETSSFEASALSSSSSSRHYAARGAGHHGIKALGRASGSGSGSSPLPSSSSSSAPVKMAPSGGPSNDGADDDESDDEDDAQANMHQPSSYTFRRRNAIVEGSEDAPKASEFSASGSGSE